LNADASSFTTAACSSSERLNWLLEVRILAFFVIAYELDDVDFVYRFSCFTAALITTVSAVTLNNPHSAFITGNHFKRWNAAAVHQELEQIVIGLACTFIIEALVKARFDVNIIQMDKHAIVSAGDNAAACHLTK
jgi:flagellar biosynthesis protein FliR